MKVMKPLLSLDLILFPVVFAFSPFIFIFIKVLAVLQPSNELLNSQRKLGDSGEILMEAVPQLTLQCYEVLKELKPGWKQWFSIATSALSLSLLSIEQYVTERSEDYGFKSIIKNISVLSPASMFKILSVAILTVFFKWFNFAMIVVNCILYLICLEIIPASLFDMHTKMETRLFWNTYLFSGVTTLIGKSKDAAVCRLVSSIYYTIVYTIILIVIIGICNNDPVNVDLYFVVWSELPLVQDITTLNILLSVTICLGWLSLVMDIITAAVKFYCCGSSGANTEDQEDGVSFWSGAILLDGLKY